MISGNAMTQTAHVKLPIGQDLPEKRWVGASFSRAACHYDRVAALQRQIGEQLLARLTASAISPKAILDVGAGTGYCTARLVELFPEASLFALDISEGMLRTLRRRPVLCAKALCVCGDGESLPLRDACVDLVLSNLALQWCTDLPAALGEFRRVLRPRGMMLFSTFGEGTLRELREAWSTGDAYSHVNAFVPSASVTKALAGFGVADFETQCERRVIAYPGVDALLQELKCLGAHNITRNRPRHLTGKGVFRKMLSAYPKATPEGGIEASFEIIQGRWVQAGATG